MQTCKRQGYNYACSYLASNFNAFFNWLDTCTKYTGPSYEVFIKFSVDKDDAKELRKDAKDIKFKLRNFKQSEAAHDVKKSFQAWMKSEEAQNLGNVMQEFSESEDAKDIA